MSHKTEISGIGEKIFIFSLQQFLLVFYFLFLARQQTLCIKEYFLLTHEFLLFLCHKGGRNPEIEVKKFYSLMDNFFAE